MLQNIKKIEGVPCGDSKKNSEETSHKVEKKIWNGFVFHVRGFGCVQHQVLSNYGKIEQCAQKVGHSTS